MDARRLLLAATLPALLAACGEISGWWRTGEVGRALQKALRERASAEIDLRPLTRFSWDELHVFAAPTTPREACRKLRLSKEDCDRKINMTSIRADESLLVFREKERIVHVETLLRANGDFSRSIHLMPFRHGQAVFLVTAGPRPPGGESPLYLHPRGAPEQTDTVPGSGAIQMLPAMPAAPAEPVEPDSRR
ncbi:MAG: hypothetical protein OEX21_06520 [Betaproteobacteria bacterium]|nr:hypothetical protein [Betaproteobacteria bacterium]